MMTPEEKAYNEALREWGLRDMPAVLPELPASPTKKPCPCIYCSGNRKYAEEEAKENDRRS